MNRSSLAALVSLNALLLAALAWVEWSPRAQAQSMSRTRASYAMTGGTLMGVSQGVVYIINETDQELIALMWNERTKQFQGLGYRNIAADLSSVQRVRP
jgi:hypothetical protein